MLRGSSEEIATISSSRKVLYSREKVLLDRVVCLITVDSVDIDARLTYPIEGVIGCENKFVGGVITLHPLLNHMGASGLEVVSFPTMDVKNRSICDILQELGRQLLCQKDPRSDHNDRSSVYGVEDTDTVMDHRRGLASAR